MRMQFTITLKGEDTIDQKFRKSLTEHPTIQMDLIRAFSQALMMAFRLDDSDKVIIDSFKGGRIPDEQPKETVIPEEKKIEN